MVAFRSFSFGLLAVATRGTSADSTRGSVVEVQASDIAPSLHPKSDKKFFDKDYPDDLRPEIAHRFDHPYPTVQDDSDYDRDFVDDENHDNGEWTAQMEYDALKTRLQRERAEMNRAKQKMEEEKREYEEISGKEAEAERETEALEERAERAADAAADSEDAAAVHKKKAAGHAEDVEEEIEDLKKCEDELHEAKEELKQLLEQVKAADKEANAAADKADDAEAESVEAEKEEADLEKKVTKLDTTHKAILKKYEEKSAELKLLEEKLADAARALAKFRSPHMDQKGAVTDDKSADTVAFHSGSLRGAERPVIVFTTVLSLWFVQ